MSKRLKGFTLVELLVVVAILIVLATIMTGAFNPAMMIIRANDARRKKDLGRIRVSFEDYYNDNNCYPGGEVLSQLLEEDNCGSGVFSPWMNSWPCDPELKQPYTIVVDLSDCPSWFKVYTKLGNENDGDIPDDWYDHDLFYKVGGGQLTNEDTNYGTSSTNVFWYDYELAQYCGQGCYAGFPPQCAQIGYEGTCEGDYCYTHPSCLTECKVPSCEW